MSAAANVPPRCKNDLPFYIFAPAQTAMMRRLLGRLSGLRLRECLGGAMGPPQQPSSGLAAGAGFGYRPVGAGAKQSPGRADASINP
jgi:hypothetical protein